MTAIAELRQKAAEKFKGYPVDFGTDTVIFKSMLTMDEKELNQFSEAQAKLTKLDEEETDVDIVRKEFVDCLVSVAEDKRKARKFLAGESIATLMVIFEDYGAFLGEASKSEGAE